MNNSALPENSSLHSFTCWSGHLLKFKGREITVFPKTGSVQKFTIPQLSSHFIRKEIISQAVRPAGFDYLPQRTRINYSSRFNIPGLLQPESVSIFTENKINKITGLSFDFFSVDSLWGGINFKKSADSQKLFINYAYLEQRLDILAINKSGCIKIFYGLEQRTAPPWPLLPIGWNAIARIYLRVNNHALTAENIFPVYDKAYSNIINYENTPARNLIIGKSKKQENSNFNKPGNTRLYTDIIPLQNLINTENAFARIKCIFKNPEIKILFFGDSITEANDIFPAEHRYTLRTEIGLRSLFPGKNFIFINSGIGGTNSAYGRRRFKNDVLKHKPDIVIIIFVLNDADVSDRTVIADHKYFIHNLRRIGAEPVFMTPNMKTAALQNNMDHAVERIRTLCKEKCVLCADAYAVWEKLSRYSIPYESLLLNGINHPDSTAHAIFSKSILHIFSGI